MNASRRPSRDAAHHSGSGRMASPYPMGDFHLLFFASFLAHSVPGSSTDLNISKSDFRSSYKSGLKSGIEPCPFRANNGSSFRLDRLVGEHDKRRRDRELSGHFRGKALHRSKRWSVRHRLPKNYQEIVRPTSD